MHELSLAQQIVEIALAAIPPGEKDPRIEAVHLRVGKFTAVVPENLRFCFDVVTRDTRHQGARLEIEEVPVAVRCLDCQATQDLPGLPFSCRTCGSGRLDMIHGRELLITSVELADQP